MLPRIFIDQPALQVRLRRSCDIPWIEFVGILLLASRPRRNETPEMPIQLRSMCNDNRNRRKCTSEGLKGIPSMLPDLAVLALILAGKAYCQSTELKWQTKGFEEFRSGTFGASGANLYVSRQGNLETIHNFDVNSDGYTDVLFNNTHDIAYVVPSYEYEFHDRDKPTLKTYPT